MDTNPRIEDWAFERYPYSAPELSAMVLIGKVFDHPRYADNSKITTSILMDVDWNKLIATTRSRSYKLGKPDREYVEWCRQNPSPHTPNVIALYENHQ